MWTRAGTARKLAAKANDGSPGYPEFGGIGFLPAGMLGGWAPGAMARRLPADTGILLPKGADIVLEVHYHQDGKPETDRTQVALYFNKGHGRPARCTSSRSSTRPAHPARRQELRTARLPARRL